MDLKGQVSEAFSKEEYFRKWGLHYVRSLALAHANGVCINFKDPGVQHYGGKRFNALRDQFEKVFLTIESPKPSKTPETIDPVTKAAQASAQAHAAPVNMATYYNAYAGCFTPETIVQTESGEFRQIQSLRKGDVVKTSSGAEARIVCVMKTIVGGPIPIVRLGDEIGLTCWHPMKEAYSGQWSFPVDVHPEKKTVEIHEAVFNLVLDEGHEVLLGKPQIAAVTLAHGNMVDPVLKHEYFGTQAIVEDLKKYRGWEEGLVEVHASHFKRDPLTNLINKITQA